MSASATVELRDVHAPAKFYDGEVHWQMASGHDAVDVSVTAAALHVLGPAPLASYLELFEQNREFLCAVAAAKAAAGKTTRIRIDRWDIPSPPKEPERSTRGGT